MAGAGGAGAAFPGTGGVRRGRGEDRFCVGSFRRWRLRLPVRWCCVAPAVTTSLASASLKSQAISWPAADGTGGLVLGRNLLIPGFITDVVGLLLAHRCFGTSRHPQDGAWSICRPTNGAACPTPRHPGAKTMRKGTGRSPFVPQGHVSQLPLRPLPGRETMSTTNGGPAEDVQPQLNVVANTSRISVENPNAPRR